jgi:AraC-like DNA-binding protein
VKDVISAKVGGASQIAVNESGEPLLILPQQWSGIPLGVYPIPYCEERGPSSAEYPMLFLALSGHGQRWYRYGTRVLELETTTGGIELHGSDYQREGARWKGLPGYSVGMHLTPQVVSRLVKGMPDFDMVTTHEFFDPKIQWLVRELLEEAQRGAPGGPLYAESLSCALIAYLAKGYGKKTAYDQPAGGLSAINRSRVIDYIEAHLGDQISITAMAMEVGLSPHHFSRSFTASVGQTPHRYLQQRRIEAAFRMLTLSSRSISDIAMDLGFSDQSHFTRVFRQQTGMTPSQTRST